VFIDFRSKTLKHFSIITKRKGGIATMVKRVVFTTLILVLSVSLVYAQWEEQESGSDSFLNGVYFADENNGWAVGWTNTVLHTSDGGENWEIQDVPPTSNYRSVFFVDAMEGWAVGSHSQIIHTIDAGQNWIEQTSDGGSFSDVFFLDSEIGWVAGGLPPSFGSDATRYVHHTIDGGETWDMVYYSEGLQEWPIRDIYFTDPDTGWAVCEIGDILYTTDSGDNWTEQTSGVNVDLFSVHFFDVNTGWACGEDGVIIHTENGGETWMPQSSGTTESLTDIQFLNENDGWVVGGPNEMGLALYTEDGGETWIEDNPGTSTILMDAHFIDTETGWGIGHNGTIVHRGGEPSAIDNDDQTQIPSTIKLHQNYPNPFNPETTIHYDLPVSDDVTLKIYDSSGKLIREWNYQNQSGGYHSIRWDGTNDDNQKVTSGIYIFSLETGTYYERRKMVLLK
jgi:photosystem II stability/assembly factor-like uncharacterized protein